MQLKSFNVIALVTASLISSSVLAALPSSGEKVAPAEVEQFQPILAASKLQISDPNGKEGNKKEVAQDSNFTGVVNDNFYVDKDSQAFVFKMAGNKHRSELRVLENFRTDLSDTFYHLSAMVQPINPMDSVKNSDFKQNEMTFMQVHNKGTTAQGDGYIPHPLLRVVWRKELKGKQGHYWAMIKNNAIICKGENADKTKVNTTDCKQKAYTQYDLGPYNAEKPTQFDVIVGNNHLVVKVDGQEKVDHNIDYWAHFLSYFKAGVYNQFSNGESEIHFYQLHYSVEKK